MAEVTIGVKNIVLAFMYAFWLAIIFLTFLQLYDLLPGMLSQLYVYGLNTFVFWGVFAVEWYVGTVAALCALILYVCFFFFLTYKALAFFIPKVPILRKAGAHD